MRRVEKPIKCLPVWYPEDGIELLASWPIRMLGDSPQPMRGQQMDQRYSRDQVKLWLRLLIWSAPGDDFCWMFAGSQNFSMHFNLQWLFVESLSRDQGPFHYPEEPPAVMSHHQEHHRTNISCHHHHGLRGQRTDTQTGTLPGVMGAIMIAECVTGLTNPIVLSICLSA